MGAKLEVGQVRVEVARMTRVRTRSPRSGTDLSMEVKDNRLPILKMVTVRRRLRRHRGRRVVQLKEKAANVRYPNVRLESELCPWGSSSMLSMICSRISRGRRGGLDSEVSRRLGV